MNLTVEELRAGYGSAVVIEGLHLALEDGQAIAVLGRNGMGKSTLLKALVGLLRGSSGSVKVDGVETMGMPTCDLIRLGIGYAPQEEAIFGELSVGDNLEAGGLVRRPEAQRWREVLDFFPVLEQRRHQRAGTLSGGEQRMLALARVLLARPKLIVLDEISAGLQPAVVAVVEKALRWERRNRGTTILMVEQNLDLSLRLADRVTVMKLGRIIAERPTDADGIKHELVEYLAP